MLLINGMEAGTSDSVTITHKVENQGKPTEEHIIRIYRSGNRVLDIKDLIGSYILSADAAKELKAHL